MTTTSRRIRNWLAALQLAFAILLSTSDARSLASCNSTFADERTICFEYNSFPLVAQTYTLTAGTWRIETSDLKPSSADTTIWLLAAGGSTVVAANDDTTGFASRIDVVISTTSTYVVLIASYSENSIGTTDLTLTRNGVTMYSINDIVFGGWTRQGFRAEVGDRMFVGAPVGTDAQSAPASRMYYFTNQSRNCTANCGVYQTGTSQVVTLSQLRVNTATANGRILVGSGITNVLSATRYFHSRLGTSWGANSRYSDPDCDGLTQEIERSVSSTEPNFNIATCDDLAGTGCDWRFPLSGPSWHPSDTDNDGYRDDEELYGARFACTKSGVPPFHNPGACFRRTWDYGCGATVGGTLLNSIALSTLGADPKDYDVFVELVHTTESVPSQAMLDHIEHIFEVEGLQCTQTTSQSVADCPNDLSMYSHIDTHLFPRQVSGSPFQQNFYTNFPPNEHFNSGMSSSRKIAGKFLLAYLTGSKFDAGVAFPKQRVMLTFGDPVRHSSVTLGQVFAHELGHMLGLLHGGSENDAKKHPYTSLMSYLYDRATVRYPMKQDPVYDNDIWPDDIGVPCVGHNDCLFSRRCVAGTCALNCDTQYGRFSRGLGGISEASASEYNTSVVQTTWVACEPGNPHNAGCAGTVSEYCWADWNGNGVLQANVSSDQNHDGDSIDGFVKDNNDWGWMYRFGKDGRCDNYRQALRVFSSDLESATAPTDSSSWGATITAVGLNSTSLSLPDYGFAVRFPNSCGPACPKSLTVTPDANNNAIKSVGVQVDSDITPKGFRLDLFFRVNDFNYGSQSGGMLSHSNLFSMYVLPTSASSGLVAARINTGSGFSPPFYSTTTLQLGTWYWVSLQWKRNTGHARVVVVPWVSGQFDPTGTGTCTGVTLPWLADVDPGAITFGLFPGNGYQFEGDLDQIHLFNTTCCAWQDPSIADLLSVSCGTAGSGCDDGCPNAEDGVCP